MKLVLIHCKPSLLDEIKELDLPWSYSPVWGEQEIDVLVPDRPYDDSYYQDPDEQLCEIYGLDYDQVNCVELA